MDSSLFFNAFIYLAAATLAAPLGRRLGIGAVLGYLVVGAVHTPAGTKNQHRGLLLVEPVDVIRANPRRHAAGNRLTESAYLEPSGDRRHHVSVNVCDPRMGFPSTSHFQDGEVQLGMLITRKYMREPSMWSRGIKAASLRS